MSDAAKITSLEKKIDVASKSITDLELKVSILTGQNQELRNKAAEARREQNLREPDAREKGRHEEMKKSMREEINRLNTEYTAERRLHQNAVREREKVVQEANQVNREWMEKDQRTRAEKAEIEAKLHDIEAWLTEEKALVTRQRQTLQLLQDEAADYKSSARAAEAERDRVKDEVYELNKKIDSLTATNERLRLEGTDHREQVKTLRTKIGTLQVESEQHLQQHYAQEGIIASHIQNLKTIEEEKRALEDCLQKKDLELAEATDKMGNLEQEVIVQRSAKEEVEETLQRERSRADREQKVSSDIDTGYRQLQKRYDGLFEKLQEKEKECIVLKTQNTTLEHDLEGIKEERAKLTESHKKIESKKIALEERLNTREREVSLSQNQFSKETQSLAEKIEDLSSQLTVMKEAKERAEESVQKTEGYNEDLQRQLDDQLLSFKDLTHRHDETTSKLNHVQEMLIIANEEISQLKETVVELRAEASSNGEGAAKRAEKQQRQIDLLESRRSALEAANKQLESQLDELDASSKSQRSALNRRINTLEGDLAATIQDKADIQESLEQNFRSLEKMQVLYNRECESREAEGSEMGGNYRILKKEHAATLVSLSSVTSKLNQAVEDGNKVATIHNALKQKYNSLSEKSAQDERKFKLTIQMHKADQLRLELCASVLIAQREKKEHAATFYEAEFDKISAQYVTVARSLDLVMKEAAKQFVSVEKLLGEEPAKECRSAIADHRTWKQEIHALKEELAAFQHAKECEITELREQMADRTTIFKQIQAQLNAVKSGGNANVVETSLEKTATSIASSRGPSYTAAAAVQATSFSKSVSNGTKRDRSDVDDNSAPIISEVDSNIASDQPEASKGAKYESAGLLTKSISPADYTSNAAVSRQVSQSCHSVSRPMDDRAAQSLNPSVSPVPLTPSRPRQQQNTNTSEQPQRDVAQDRKATTVSKSVQSNGSSTGRGDIINANRMALDEWTSTNSSYHYASNINSPASKAAACGGSASPAMFKSSPFKSARVSIQNPVTMTASASPSHRRNDDVDDTNNYGFENARATIHKQ